jgi:hypothetical protein
LHDAPVGEATDLTLATLIATTVRGVVQEAVAAAAARAITKLTGRID